MKRNKAIAFTMASLLLTGSLTGCHIDKEQMEKIKETLSDEEIAKVVQILDSHGIVITEDGIDIPGYIVNQPNSGQGEFTALYGPPYVFDIGMFEK